MSSNPTAGDGNVQIPAVPAAPPAFGRPLPSWRFMAQRNDFLSIVPEGAFERDACELHAMRHRFLLLNDPDAVQHVLRDHSDRYARSATLQRLFRRALGESLITTEGDTWRQHRQIMAPAFSRRNINRHAPLIAEATAVLLADWEHKPEGAPVDLVAAVRRLMITIIYQAMFSTYAPDDVALVQESVPGYVRAMRPGIFDLLPNWVPRLPAGRPRRVVPGLDMVVERLIARRNPSRSRAADDLLDLLLAAVENGRGMSIGEAGDHVAHILIAGHETTEQTLLWAWYLLSQHPAEESVLHAEVDRVLAGRSPNTDDLLELPYTRMVIEETLRLYPPGHTLARRALTDDELPGGRFLPKGSQVLIAPWVIHRHRRLWHQPDRFYPERFASDRTRTHHPFAYIPFGGGPRICLGAGLGMMLATLILADISQHYRLRVAAGQQIEPYGAVTLRPRNGMTMIPERRRRGG
jgi:cytochrome P450